MKKAAISLEQGDKFTLTSDGKNIEIMALGQEVCDKNGRHKTAVVVESDDPKHPLGKLFDLPPFAIVDVKEK